MTDIKFEQKVDLWPRDVLVCTNGFQVCLCVSGAKYMRFLGDDSSVCFFWTSFRAHIRAQMCFAVFDGQMRDRI